MYIMSTIEAFCESRCMNVVELVSLDSVCENNIHSQPQKKHFVWKDCKGGIFC